MTTNQIDALEFATLIEGLQRKIKVLELQISNPDVMNIPSGGSSLVGLDQIYFPDEDGDGYIDAFETIDPPDNIVVTSGSFYDTTYLDIEWDDRLNAGGGYSVYVMEEISPGVYEHERAVQVASTSLRIEPVKPLTTYAVQVASLTYLGIEGARSAVVLHTTGADQTIPPAPTNVVVGRGATTVMVTFTPLTAAQAADVANSNGLYEIEIDTSNTFASPDYHMQRTAASVAAFNDIIGEGSWYARVRAIDSSGNSGIWSDIVGPVAAGGVNDSMMVADLSAAKITAGFLAAARIQAGTLTADKLTTSELTTASIRLNGGEFTVGSNPTYSGLVINSQGIRGYRFGTMNFSLDSSGNVVVKGDITGSTGSFGGTTLDALGLNILVAPTDVYNTVYSIDFVTSGGVNKGRIWAYDFGGFSNFYIEGQGSFGEVIVRASGFRFYNAVSGGSQIFSAAGSNVAVNGNFNVSGGSKNFLIDHPLGKKGMALIHSTLEGPEAAVFYRGISKLVDGKATIQLPDYFEALVRKGTATVQVTPIGTPSPLAVSKVQKDSFSVIGEAGERTEFFWRVEAERGDIPPLAVEVMKEDVDGTEESRKKNRRSSIGN